MLSFVFNLTKQLHTTYQFQVINKLNVNFFFSSWELEKLCAEEEEEHRGGKSKKQNRINSWVLSVEHFGNFSMNFQEFLKDLKAFQKLSKIPRVIVASYFQRSFPWF